MGESSSSFIQHILIYSTPSHHSIIPSPHHPLLYFTALLLFSPYTITDLSFGVVPGGNPALSPAILVDAGSTSKRSNSKLSSINQEFSEAELAFKAVYINHHCQFQHYIIQPYIFFYFIDLSQKRG